MARAQRVALTTPLLAIPPTYFVTEHAEAIQRSTGCDEHRFHLFPLASSIKPGEISIGASPAVTWPGRYASRQRLASLGMAQQARLVAAAQPDIIHQHHGVWTAGAVLAKHLSGAPLVTTLHGADAINAARRSVNGLQRVHRWNTRLAFAHSDRLLAVSDHLRTLAIRAGADARRVTVHYQGINTDYFTPGGGSSALTQRLPRILAISTLTPRKRIDLLIAASCELARQVPHELHIVGAGPLDAALRAQASASPHIQFHGQVPRARVREFLREADQLVLPSSDEAAGLVILEAQSCGLSAVVTGGDGKAEMVSDGVTGAVTSENPSAVDLAASMRDWLPRTDQEKAELAERTRQFVVRERSVAAGAEALLAIYGSVRT